MKDENGLYYHPFPQNKRVRMYVRRSDADVEFRLWNQDDPMLWSEHGWVPHTAIVQAEAIYSGGKFEPGQAYDRNVAEALLADDPLA
jgi:hypothetical protein